jgi:Icc-related predicted phosphoesterase
VHALVFGDLHGHIRAMYARAEQARHAHRGTVETILQVGDFGVYPVPDRLDEEKRAKYGPGDYAALEQEGWEAPIPTWFCKGNNEDFEALAGPLPPGLHYVPNGTVHTFGNTRVAFLGGSWSRKSYESSEPKPKHIARAEVEALYGEDFDVLISHEGPAGRYLPGRRYDTGAPPLRALIENKRPRLMIHGHHHQYARTRIGETEVVALGRCYGERTSGGAFMPLEL